MVCVEATWDGALVERMFQRPLLLFLAQVRNYLTLDTGDHGLFHQLLVRAHLFVQFVDLDVQLGVLPFQILDPSHVLLN